MICRIKEVKIVNIARIDLLESKTTANLDELKDILIANYGNRLTDIIDDSCFEDSVCPPNPVCDQIISEMISSFKAATGEDIVLVDMWGHIHEKNMSTTLHNHRESYVSAVCYVEVPGGCWVSHIQTKNKISMIMQHSQLNLIQREVCITCSLVT